MCYCCSWNSSGSTVDLISESTGYLCALWFLGGLNIAGFRASQGERGLVFYCHSTATVSLVVRWNDSGSYAMFDAYYMHSLEAWDGISAKFSKSDLGNGLK